MDDTIVLVSDDGQEYEMRILLTFDNEETGKHYVFITDLEPNADAEEQNVLVYTYDDDGNLEPVTDEEEFAMCEEVLLAFTEENDG